MARIEAFLDPFGQADAAGYQVTQTLIALASGGLLGQGLGSSRGNVGVLPAGHTDVILAIVGQELGLVFTLLILALYLFVGYRGFRIGARAPDAFVAALSGPAQHSRGDEHGALYGNYFAFHLIRRLVVGDIPGKRGPALEHQPGSTG